MADSIQSLCTQGQDFLLQTDYLSAERVLARAEQMAWETRDWDALARLYLPLQETRRQRRQRAIDGQFLFQQQQPEAALPSDLTAGSIVLGGPASIAPAIELRRLVTQRQLYIDVFLAAFYGLNEQTVILIIPSSMTAVPPEADSIDALLRHAPPHSVILQQQDLPANQKHMNDAAGAFVMELWEKLHRPFLAAADACGDPVQRIALYRQTIAVDYACELAHQKLSQTARSLSRSVDRQSSAAVLPVP